jgi:hypothetical protein
MEIKTKTIFVSNDGNEFDTEADCLKWENRKYFKNPIHLTDTEITGLLKTI